MSNTYSIDWTNDDEFVVVRNDNLASVRTVYDRHSWLFKVYGSITMLVAVTAFLLLALTVWQLDLRIVYIILPIYAAILLVNIFQLSLTFLVPK